MIKNAKKKSSPEPETTTKTDKVADVLNKMDDKQNKKNKNTKKTVIAILVGVAILALIGFGVYKVMPKDQSVKKEVRVEKMGEADTRFSDKLPIKLPEWATLSYQFLTDGMIEEMNKAQEDNFIGWSASPYPEEADGFTTDKSKAYDKDGLPNEFYTNLTKDTYTTQMAKIINRIVNPLFGEWAANQKPENTDKNVIIEKLYAGMATTEYMEALENNKAQSVIFYDVNNDRYGGKLPQEAYSDGKIPFIGVVEDGEILAEGDNIMVDMKVNYKSSENTIFAKKNIKLNLIVTENGQILIDGGEISDR